MTEKAILLRTFKTLRADGHAVRTIYALAKNGNVIIEHRFVSTELNDGCILIRKFNNLFYQYERMIFKLESFMTICKEISESIYKLNKDDILQIGDVIAKPNEKRIVTFI